MYPCGCGKQKWKYALEYRTQSGWYNSRGRPADPFGYGVLDEGKRRSGPWGKGVEKKHGRTDAGGGRTVCGRGRDHVYTKRLSLYRERRLYLCDLHALSERWQISDPFFCRERQSEFAGVSWDSACGYAARLCGAGCVARGPGRASHSGAGV